MNRSRHILFLFFFVHFFGYDLYSQFSIRYDTGDKIIDFNDIVPQQLSPSDFVAPDYRTEFRRIAERRHRRKERNSFELNATVQATQIYFSNWANGGDNTFNGLSTLSMTYKYNRNKLSITSRFDSRLGVSIIDTTTFKNEDKFEFSTLVTWAINDNWSYSGRVNFRSQFMKGYKSRTNKTLVSAFLSPGTLDVGLGFTFNPKDSPWEVVISPLTGSTLFVLNEELSESGAHGIDEGEHIKPMIGPR
ncbi:MAG: DUF3078 domain-containing protein [Rikenellaceae bacterium]|nr:DUF3078 domain-containing protein [Rikenellaceae bacterium]